MQSYIEKTFNIGELEGLSKKQIDAHLGLYAGYVKNVNKIADQIEAYKQDSEANAVALAELKRRFGFEFNGMRLHELYFEQFESVEDGGSALREAIEAQWGSFEVWMAEMRAVASMRGIGWALLVRDGRTGNLFNVWVGDHEVGHLGGQDILLAIDIWEHAYLLDYAPSERGLYLDAFFKNLKWGVVESRF